MKHAFSFALSVLVLTMGVCLLTTKAIAQATVPPEPASSLKLVAPQQENLTLLDLRTNKNVHGLPEMEVGQAVIEFSAADLAVARPVLKLTSAGARPVTFEVHSPCRISIQSDKPGEKMHYSGKVDTYSGGVRVEVSEQGRTLFVLTADEVIMNAKISAKKE